MVVSARWLWLAWIACACGAAEQTPRERAEALVQHAHAQQKIQTEPMLRAAIAELERALAQWLALGDFAHAAAVAGDIGEAWDNLGDMTQARAWSERALVLSRVAGDRHGEAMALSWVGIAEVHLGMHAAAIAKFERARTLAPGDDAAVGYALLNLGFVYQRVDEWTRAIDFLTAALPVFERNRDRGSLATCHNNLGQHYLLVGDDERALYHHTRALEIRTTGAMRLDRGWSLLNIAAVYLQLRDDPAAALVEYRKAREAWVEVGNKVGLPLVIDGMGGALERLGKLEEARGEFADAIERYREIKSPRGMAESSINLAQVLAKLGRRADAIAAFEAGLAGSRTAERPSEQARALLGLARLDRAAGDLVAARRRVDEALALIETVRARVIRDEQRTSWFGTVHGAYELAIDLAIEAGEVEAALAASERGRARTLLEALARSGGSDSAVAVVAPAELRAALDADTIAVSYVLGDAVSHAFVATRDDVIVVDLAPRAQIDEAARRFVEAASRVDGAIDEPGRALAALVVEPIARRSEPMRVRPRIAIVGEGALQFAPLGVLPGLRDRELAWLPSLAALVELRRRGAGDGSAREHQPAPDLAPPPVRGSEPLAPGGSARWSAAPTLELAVLADPVFASDDPRVAAPRPPAGATPVRLRWSRLEADGITRPVAADRRVVFLDQAATTTAVLGREVARARIVHFATHAIVDAVHPERSTLLLSSIDAAGAERDNRLTLADIQKLSWAADLVVLSGCRTALGRDVRGEGLVGLVGGFLRAGARRVVASLWQVDDRATAELMIRFHAALRAGAKPAAALVTAQRAISAMPAWRSPYYWAGFALYGDWQ